MEDASSNFLKYLKQLDFNWMKFGALINNMHAIKSTHNFTIRYCQN